MLHGHVNSISAVHAAGTSVCTGDWDGHVRLWDVGAALGARDDGVATKVRRVLPLLVSKAYTSIAYAARMKRVIGSRNLVRSILPELASIWGC